MRLNKYCHATDCRYFIDLKESTGHEICGRARVEFFGGCHNCPLYEIRAKTPAGNADYPKQDAKFWGVKWKMKADRAINYLRLAVKGYLFPGNRSNYREYQKALDIAEDAISRIRDAKKPMISLDCYEPYGAEYSYVCPLCKKTIDETDYFLHCPYCGQLIDWSDIMNEKTFTIVDLQKALNDKGWTGKILYVEAPDITEDMPTYWIVYTTDPDCQGRDDYSHVTHLAEGEADIVAADIEEAVEFILHPVSFSKALGAEVDDG